MSLDKVHAAGGWFFSLRENQTTAFALLGKWLPTMFVGPGTGGCHGMRSSTVDVICNDHTNSTHHVPSGGSYSCKEPGGAVEVHCPSTSLSGCCGNVTIAVV